MATLRTIRNRIKGTRNIKQITRAMEAVSAVKMRKSQVVALAARPYAVAALGILRNITASTRPDLVEITRSGLVERREVNTVLLVVITSDKGLAGPFNANVIRGAEQFLDSRPGKVEVATVGRKAAVHFSKPGRRTSVFRHAIMQAPSGGEFAKAASWTGFGDYAELSEVEPLFDFVLQAFSERQADEVHIVYTNFLSAMKQEVVVRKLLPFSEEGLTEMVRGIVPEKGRFSEVQLQRSPEVEPRETREYLFEPSPKEIFDSILPALLKIQLYHAILEANASEHSSRMVAMRNATDNASELIKSYTVSLNKARQAAINKELAEITGGSEALAQ